MRAPTATSNFYAAGQPVNGVVPKAWLDAVIDDGRVERIPYELCVLIALRDALRRREVYVQGAGRWKDPDEDLPGDFEDNRDVHYAALSQPAGRRGVHRQSAQAAGGRADPARYRPGQGHRRRGADHHPARFPWVSVPKLSKLPEPENLGAVKAEIEPGGAPSTCSTS